MLGKFDTKFSKDQINALQLGFVYAIEKSQKQYLNTLIIETGYAIRRLDTQIHTFRYLVSRKIKQIAETNTHNTLHKRHQYNLIQKKPHCNRTT